MEIINEVRSPLLNRSEYSLNLVFEGSTPKTDVIKEQIVSKLKVPKEKIIIKKIDQVYGQRKAIVYAYVYDDLKVLDDVEVIKNKKYKKTLADEKKKRLEEKKAKETASQPTQNGQEKTQE